MLCRGWLTRLIRTCNHPEERLLTIFDQYLAKLVVGWILQKGNVVTDWTDDERIRFATTHRAMPDNQLIWGAHTKIKYGKEHSPRGRECECSQEERSTSITKRLVFPSTRFAIKRAVIEFWSVSFNRMITTFCRRGSVCASLSEASRCCRKLLVSNCHLI